MTIICHIPYSFQIKTQVVTCYSGLTHFCFCSVSGLVFTKGLRLSQVLGLNPVLKLRLLSQLSFVLKPYSQRVTWLSRRLSNNHSGFLCHVTYELLYIIYRLFTNNFKGKPLVGGPYWRKAKHKNQDQTNLVQGQAISARPWTEMSNHNGGDKPQKNQWTKGHGESKTIKPVVTQCICLTRILKKMEESKATAK